MRTRALLLDARIIECGCNLQIWVQGDALHVGPCCASCQVTALEAVRANFGQPPILEDE